MNPGADPAALSTDASVHAADERLMQAWIDGDTGASERLYARHRGPLRFMARQARNPRLADEP